MINRSGKYSHIKEMDKLEQMMFDAGLEFLFIDVTDDGEGVLVLTDEGRQVKEFIQLMQEREREICYKYLLEYRNYIDNLDI
jgi:hypothetical protein